MFVMGFRTIHCFEIAQVFRFVFVVCCSEIGEVALFPVRQSCGFVLSPAQSSIDKELAPGCSYGGTSGFCNYAGFVLLILFPVLSSSTTSLLLSERANERCGSDKKSSFDESIEFDFLAFFHTYIGKALEGVLSVGF